jgi:type I restriction enzyme S subunit
MKAYPNYKDSGVTWLGQVPEHWESLKLRTILNPNTKRKRPDLPLLSVVREKGVIKRNIKDKEENHNTIPEDLSNYKVVRSGQFAMNKMKAWQGSYGVSAFDGIVSPAYFIFDINRVGGEFFHLAMRSKSYVPFFTRASDGVRIGQWDLNQTRMKEIPFFVPPPDEQQQISRYLDWQTSKINKFIKAKKKLIALLKEQKQNIINEAVTKGINPDVEMKDSGVEWLGEIPAHWIVRRAKYLFKQEDIRSETGKEELLSVSHLTGVTPRSQKSINMFLAENYIGSKICKPGFIAVNTMWAWMAALGVSKYEGVISSSYHTYSQRAEFFDEAFLDTLLRSSPMKSAYTVNSSGITSSRMRLYPDDFLRLFFVCPPILEQQEIIIHIEKETALIDKTISRTEREIELIQEYRTRLVSDVVTGKVDVRSVAIPDFEPVEADLEAQDDEESEDELITEGIEE